MCNQCACQPHNLQLVTNKHCNLTLLTKIKRRKDMDELFQLGNDKRMFNIVSHLLSLTILYCYTELNTLTKKENDFNAKVYTNQVYNCTKYVTEMLTLR